MKKLWIFIVNPNAGNGKGEKVWKKIKTELLKRDVAYRSFFTRKPGHAEDLTKQMTHIHHEHLKGVVAVGGDGTIHEVMNGLTEYLHIPVGFISAGSGNDFARGYRLPRSPLKALDHILRSNPERLRKYDLGEYRTGQRKHHTSYFVSSLGIGFDGEVTKRTNESKYKGLLNNVGLGSLSYVLTVLKLSMTYTPFELKLRVDGKEHLFEDVWLVATTNIAYYGGGMKICPGSDPKDGVLDLCIVHNLSRKKLFFLFGSVFFGLHTRLREVTMLKGQDIEVETNTPVMMHADGEVIGNSPVSMTVRPNQYSVI